VYEVSEQSVRTWEWQSLEAGKAGPGGGQFVSSVELTAQVEDLTTALGSCMPSCEGVGESRRSGAWPFEDPEVLREEAAMPVLRF
jgi:hypothetical protein